MRRGVTWAIAGTLALVPVATFIVVLEGAPDQGADARIAPETVSSSTRHQFAHLDELLTASDLVVSGEVIATERGRVFGGVDDEGKASDVGVRSRVVTLRIDDVLASGTAVDTEGNNVVLVEEEGWLTDGAPLIVDGAPPSRVGDRGIWFLLAAGDSEFPGFVVVNSQGRYLRTGGNLRGGDQTDPLVQALQALGPQGLSDAIRRARSA